MNGYKKMNEEEMERKLSGYFLAEDSNDQLTGFLDLLRKETAIQRRDLLIAVIQMIKIAENNNLFPKLNLKKERLKMCDRLQKVLDLIKEKGWE